MANKKIDININTTANTSGADKATKSIQQTEAAIAKAEATAQAKAERDAARAARAEAAAERAAGVAQRRAEREAKQAEAASQRKEAALKREQAAVERLQAAEEKKASKAAENAAREDSVSSTKEARGAAIKVQQAGYQVADFATQVSGGTSALVALGQQLPQFLGAFGPQGAVAGALIAVGLVAYKVFSGIGDSVEKAKERADFLAKAIDEGASMAAKALSEDYDMGYTALSNSQAIAEALRQKFVDIAKAEGEFSLAALQNSKSLNAAQIKLQEIMGKTYDPKQIIDFYAAENEAIRTQEYNNNVAAEKAKQVAAEKAKQAADQTLAQKTQAFAEQQKILSESEKELENLKNQLTVLQNISEQKATQAEIAKTAAYSGAIGGFIRSRFPSEAAKNAQKDMQNPEFVQRIPVLEAAIKELQSQVSDTGTLTKDLNSALVESQNAKTNFESTSQQVSMQLTTLANSFNQDNVIASITKIEEEGKAKAETITKLIDGVKPETTGEKQAMEQLKTAVADHEIKVSEATQTAASLATLSGKINEANSGQTQIITRLITDFSKMKLDYDALNRRLDNLQSSKSNTLPAR